MRSILSIGIAILLTLLTSCTFKNSSEHQCLNRQEVLGTWILSGQSLAKIKEKPNDKTITAFQLDSDSTAIISFGDSNKKEWVGKWDWKAEKKMGNDVLGISLKCDVVIYLNGLLALGLQLEEKNGTLNLTAADYSFVKQK